LGCWYRNQADIFASPLVASSPANQVASRIYCDLVKDALDEYAYDAEIAGLDYSISTSSVGLEIEVSGYNDKMSVLLEKVITMMKDLEVRRDRFKVIMEKALRGYRNWIFQPPYHQVGEYTRYINSQTAWLHEESLAELEVLTIEDVMNIFPKLLRQTHVEALVHGNLYKEVSVF
jgi:insulysin